MNGVFSRPSIRRRRGQTRAPGNTTRSRTTVSQSGSRLRSRPRLLSVRGAAPLDAEGCLRARRKSRSAGLRARDSPVPKTNRGTASAASRTTRAGRAGGAGSPEPEASESVRHRVQQHVDAERISLRRELLEELPVLALALPRIA